MDNSFQLCRLDFRTTGPKMRVDIKKKMLKIFETWNPHITGSLSIKVCIISNTNEISMRYMKFNWVYRDRIYQEIPLVDDYINRWGDLDVTIFVDNAIPGPRQIGTLYMTMSDYENDTSSEDGYIA